MGDNFVQHWRVLCAQHCGLCWALDIAEYLVSGVFAYYLRILMKNISNTHHVENKKRANSSIIVNRNPLAYDYSLLK